MSLNLCVMLQILVSGMQRLASVAASMRASMLERGFPSYASNKTLLLATILDPRYKTARLPNQEASEGAKSKLNLLFFSFFYIVLVFIKASCFGRHLYSTITTIA